MSEHVLYDKIWALGRGPELRRVHHSKLTGTSIVAIDYLNPDWSSESDIRHLVIHRPQVDHARGSLQIP